MSLLGMKKWKTKMTDYNSFATQELIKASEEIKKLRELLTETVGFLEHAEFDFSNGNTDSTGTIDEGNVRGWQQCGKLIDKIHETLGEEDVEEECG